MSDREKRFVAEAVNNGLVGARVDGTAGWRGKCPPPCEAVHDLANAARDHHEASPIFVYTARTYNSAHPTLGLLACGFSRLTVQDVTGPLADRLQPPLDTMVFRGILTPEIQVTLPRILRNLPPNDRDSFVEIPLINNGRQLRVDTAQLSSNAAELAAIYLL